MIINKFMGGAIFPVGCGISSKGPCRSSKTSSIQQGLTNAYLEAEGLFSLRERWITLHYPK
ncbi:hypothetical protein [Pelagibaculum spongiae]|uniref:hypothetical protein n=1 Tax=Pelagibaculum spongiae TaxID=2080658 RepID=UPI00105839DA|nr:hypothetical protein [Pelagibaculum spongiae]